jgi:hypothetical protein
METYLCPAGRTGQSVDNKPKPRATVGLDVTLTFEGTGATVRGVAENVSETGVLVRSPLVQPIGTIVRLKFDDFEAKGEVVWVEATDEGAMLGMRIVSMGWEGWRAIRGFVDEPGE